MNTNFTPRHTANYRVKLSYLWAYNDITDDFLANFTVGGTEIFNHTQEPKDSGGTSIDGSGTNQQHLATYEDIIPLTAGVATAFQLLFGTSVGGQNATIYQHTCSVERWD